MSNCDFLEIVLVETTKHKTNAFNQKVEEIKKDVLRSAKNGADWTSVDFFYPEDNLIVKDVKAHFKSLGFTWSIHCASGRSSTHCLYVGVEE